MSFIVKISISAQSGEASRISTGYISSGKRICDVADGACQYGLLCEAQSAMESVLHDLTYELVMMQLECPIEVSYKTFGEILKA